MVHLFPSSHRVSLLVACLITTAMGGCAVGPNYKAPANESPQDWSNWSSADSSLQMVDSSHRPLPHPWWKSFDDSVLESLIQRALAHSPDIQTAALHYAQSRVQREGTAAQQLPQLNANASAVRQRQSEHGASARLYDQLGSNFSSSQLDTSSLTQLLSDPYTDYQAGFDASWEPDLWGKIRRSLESDDADIAQQKALFELARLSLISDLIRNYLTLRATQQRIDVLRSEINVLSQRVELIKARRTAGNVNQMDLDSQQAQLNALKSQLPTLLADEASSINQISVLAGEHPGTLRDTLASTHKTPMVNLPDLGLGLPSTLALQRPDVQAAEAQLHSATAQIGVAKAELYPSITLTGNFGLDAYQHKDLGEWASRSWSIGPSLNLPLFNRGRLRSVVHLRELQQQEAAVNYHQTVLKAWQDVDDSLSAYSAAQQSSKELAQQVVHTRDAYELAQSRYTAGSTDYLAVLDAERQYLQARRDLINSQKQEQIEFVAINKALGRGATSQAK